MPGDFPPSPGAGRVDGQPCALVPLCFGEPWYCISGVSPAALGRECHTVEAAQQQHTGKQRDFSGTHCFQTTGDSEPLLKSFRPSRSLESLRVAPQGR